MVAQPPSKKYKRNKEHLLQKSREIIQGNTIDLNNTPERFKATFGDDSKDTSGEYYSQIHNSSSGNFRT
jgi:hypothetical protein